MKRITQLINYGGDCRTAPATLGLLNMLLRLIIPCNLQIVAPNLVVYKDQVAEVDHSL